MKYKVSALPLSQELPAITKFSLAFSSLTQTSLQRVGMRSDQPMHLLALEFKKIKTYLNLSLIKTLMAIKKNKTMKKRISGTLKALLMKSLFRLRVCSQILLKMLKSLVLIKRSPVLLQRKAMNFLL